MRKIVIGVRGGRSYVESTELVETAGPTVIWEMGPEGMPSIDHVVDAFEEVEPPVGGLRWVMSKAGSQTSEHLEAAGRVDGFHSTRTMDFNLVYEGAGMLLLDDESIEVRRGDLIVMQAAHHAWRSHDDADPLHVISVMISAL